LETHVAMDEERLVALAQLLGVSRLSSLMGVLEARIKDICAAPAAGPWDEAELSRRLHTALGSCRSLGFLTLADDIGVLQARLKRGLEDRSERRRGAQAMGAEVRRLGPCLEASLAAGRRIIERRASG